MGLQEQLEHLVEELEHSDGANEAFNISGNVIFIINRKVDHSFISSLLKTATRILKNHSHVGEPD